MTDETIKKDVVDELFWDYRVDASSVQVEVLDRVVTLTGTVPSYAALTAAAAAVWKIYGVIDVINLLSVTFPPTYKVPSDDEIRSTAGSTLAWNPDIHSIDIDIRVNGGVVTLTGTVDEYWKRWKAEELISNLRGVIRVENHLAVTPRDNALDKDIARDIESALKRDKFIDAEKVIVKVDDGEVTLTGTVVDNFSRTEAYNAAAFTPGVTAVQNELKVK